MPPADLFVLSPGYGVPPDLATVPQAPSTCALHTLKSYFVRECVEGSRCLRKTLCVCVWGNILASGERGFQEKTLNPLMLSQSSWMLYYKGK